MNKKFRMAEFYDFLSLSNCGQPQQEFRFHPMRRYKFDFAWPDEQVAIEVQGGTWTRGKHGRGSGLAKDREKLNLAAACGWLVLQFTPQELAEGRFTDILQDTLARARLNLIDLREDDCVNFPRHMQDAIDDD
jgi:hypothetical protein